MESQTPLGTTAPQEAAPVPQKSALPVGTLMLVAGGVLVIILAVVGWFVWPGPEMRDQATVRSITQSFNANDLDGALAKADAALQQRPNESMLLVHKSLTLAQKGSLSYKEKEYGSQAAAVAELAIKANPKSSEAYRALGYSYEIQQNYDKAHENYAQALKLNPNNAEAMFADAHAYDLQGNLTKAEMGYRAALALNVSLDQAHAGLARVLMMKNDIAGAVNEYKQSYTLTQNVHNKAEAAYSLGQLLAKQGKLADAAKYAEEATTLDATYPLGWYGLGKVKILESDPKAGVAATAEARLALLQGGLDALSQSIKLNKYQTVAYVELAYAQYEILKQTKPAEANLKSADVVLSKDITLSSSDKARVKNDIDQLRARMTAKK